MKKARYIAVILAVLTLSVLLMSCSSSKSYTFNVETGDSVEVKLDTSKGLDLVQSDGSFSVEKEGEAVISCVFLTNDMRNDYIAVVKAEPEAEIVTDTDKEFAWTFNGEAGLEHDKIISVENSDQTYILAGSIYEDQSVVEEAFRSLTFTVQ